MAGLGRAGRAAALALAAARGPAAVRAWDMADSQRTRAARDALRDAGVTATLGGDGVELLDRVPPPRCLVKSPGIGFDSPLLLAADRRGLAVIDELELGWRLDRRPVVGITGTNGKSTVAALVTAILARDGARPGLAGNTTFGPPLSALDPGDADVVVAEVSSFQLEGCPAFLPDAVAVTNLTQDHLDRHRTMADYARTKRRIALREGDCAAVAAVGIDDDFGRSLAAELTAAGAAVTTVGRAGRADVGLAGWEPVPGGSVVRVLAGGERLELRTALHGEHNARNALLAFATAQGLGVARTTTLEALADASAPPGRLERLGDGPIEVVVDYAHNPDGIREALRAARSLSRGTRGRLIALACALWIVVPEQRYAMGREAALGCDHLVLSADRVDVAEPADRLPPGLEEGAREAGAASVEVAVDRRAAIGAAISAARPGDVVAILGRGPRLHTIDAAGRAVRLDDRQVAREILDGL